MYAYYLHRSGGYLFDHFGGIGRPFEVSVVRAYIWKWLGYCMTPARKNAPTRSIMTRAALLRGVSRHSYRMGQMRKGEWDVL